jgi:hypothetical protein
MIFGATTAGSQNEICRITPSGIIEVFRHEESDVAQLARTAAQLMKERDEAKAYSRQVVVNITEEMNGLKAGNARLLRELEGLRGLKPLLKRARDELKECIEGQDENPDMGSPRTTDEQRAVLNDLDAAMEAGK